MREDKKTGFPQSELESVFHAVETIASLKLFGAITFYISNAYYIVKC